MARTPIQTRKLLTVAVRDFKHTVLTKAFLFAIVGVPLMILLGIGAFALIMAGHKEPPLIGTIAIVGDDTGEMEEAARFEFDEEHAMRESAVGPLTAAEVIASQGVDSVPSLERGEVRIDVRRVTGVEAGSAPFGDDLERRLQDGEFLALARVWPALLEPPGATPAPAGSEPQLELLTREDVDTDHVGLIERRLARAVVRVRAQRSGRDPDEMRALLRWPSTHTSRLLASGEAAEQSEALRAMRQYVVPMFFMMLLWGATFSGGQHLLSSTIEEKSNKVIEVLLSAVSPLELMAGKILGQCAVGLVVIGVYSSLSLVGLVAAAQADLIEPSQLVYLAVYFFMAYFMVASLMAAIGSAVSDLREANALLMPVMIVLMFPLMLWMPISQAPNGAVANVFSFIPPATPFVMMIRIAADEPVPAWQIAASIVWGYVCVVAMVWMASRIFRVGVLMQGKPPSPLELLRWLRYR